MQENSSNVVSVEQLLTHREWMSRVARGLLFHPNDVEDVSQDVWVETLSSKRTKIGNAKAWLGGIVRHVGFDAIRRKQRQSRHEPLASKPEVFLQEPGAALDRFELQHRVSQAVLELEEPYRATILLLYFEGLPPQEVAEKQGVPVNTVYSRQSRAHAKLRVALDREYGSKDAWGLGLLSFASGKGCITQGVPKVAAVLAWVGAGALFLMILSAPHLYFGNQEDPNLGSHAQNPDSQSQDSARAAAASPPNPENERFATLERFQTESPLSPIANTTQELLGTIYDEKGVPRAGLSVALLSHEFQQRLRTFHFLQSQVLPQDLDLAGEKLKALAEQISMNGLNLAQAFLENPSKSIAERLGLQAPSIVESDERGVFSFPLIQESDRPFVMDPGWINLAVRRESGVSQFSVVASQTLSLAGRVLDAHGKAISQAQVAWKFDPAEVAGLAPDTESRSQILPLEYSQGIAGLSNASGEFQLERVPRSRFGRIEFFAQGFRHASYDLPTFLSLGSVATLEARASWIIRGVLRGSDGRGVRGVMSFGVQQIFANVEGRFEKTIFDVAPDMPLFVRSPDLRPKVIERFGERVLRGEEKFIIGLEEPLSLQGTVVDAAGQPQSGLMVEIENPTRILPQINRVWLETMSRWEPVLSDAQGRFSIPGVLDRPYRLIAFRPETLEFVRVGPVSPELFEIRMVLPSSSPMRRISGMAISQEGVPIPNVSLQLKLDTCATEGTFTKLVRDVGKTDHEGKFEVAGNISAGLHLCATVEGYEEAKMLLDEESFLRPLQIVLRSR